MTHHRNPNPRRTFVVRPSAWPTSWAKLEREPSLSPADPDTFYGLRRIRSCHRFEALKTTTRRAMPHSPAGAPATPLSNDAPAFTRIGRFALEDLVSARIAEARCVPPACSGQLNGIPLPPIARLIPHRGSRAAADSQAVEANLNRAASQTAIARTPIIGATRWQESLATGSKTFAEENQDGTDIIMP